MRLELSNTNNCIKQWTDYMTWWTSKEIKEPLLRSSMKKQKGTSIDKLNQNDTIKKLRNHWHAKFEYGNKVVKEKVFTLCSSIFLLVICGARAGSLCAERASRKRSTITCHCLVLKEGNASTNDIVSSKSPCNEKCLIIRHYDLLRNQKASIKSSRKTSGG